MLRDRRGNVEREMQSVDDVWMKVACSERTLADTARNRPSP